MAITSRKKSHKKNKKKNGRTKIEIKRSAKSLNWQKFKSEKFTTKLKPPIDKKTQQSTDTTNLTTTSKPTKSPTDDTKSKIKFKKPKLKTKNLKMKNTTSTPTAQKIKRLNADNRFIVVPPQPVMIVPVPVQNTVSPSPLQYNIPVYNKFQGIDGINDTGIVQKVHQKENVIPMQYPFQLAVIDYNFFMQPGIVSAGGVRPQITQDICVGIDCEMVGIGSGRENMLARVSLVNMSGQCIYDTFVFPQAPIVDYRTSVSGIRPENVYQGANFYLVRRVVATLISNRILVGHAVSNDLKVLFFKYPRKFIRDTANYRPFREQLKLNGTPSLKRLAKDILKIGIQDGEHSSIEDARAAMSLYVQHREEWEKSLHY